MAEANKTEERKKGKVIPPLSVESEGSLKKATLSEEGASITLSKVKLNQKAVGDVEKMLHLPDAVSLKLGNGLKFSVNLHQALLQESGAALTFNKIRLKEGQADKLEELIKEENEIPFTLGSKQTRMVE